MKVHVRRPGKDRRRHRRTYCGKPIRSEEMNNHIAETIEHADCEVCIQAYEAKQDRGMCL